MANKPMDSDTRLTVNTMSVPKEMCGGNWSRWDAACRGRKDPWDRSGDNVDETPDEPSLLMLFSPPVPSTSPVVVEDHFSNVAL
jgi:hypothetical protein